MLVHPCDCVDAASLSLPERPRVSQSEVADPAAWVRGGRRALAFCFNGRRSLLPAACNCLLIGNLEIHGSIWEAGKSIRRHAGSPAPLGVTGEVRGLTYTENTVSSVPRVWYPAGEYLMFWLVLEEAAG